MVTDTYGFSAFGVQTGGSGASPNPYRFAGERRDPESGLYQLRARYYDPAVGDHQGRFIPALRDRGMAAVMAETAARPEPRLMVTDEDLAKFLVEPAGAGLQAHALAAAARPWFRPHVIYFARRQDHLAESHFAQGAKT